MIDYLRRVRRICAWLPILWRDRDWDYAYLVRIVEFKLARMERALGSEDAVSLHGPRRAREIRIAIEHLKRHRDAMPYGPPRPPHALEFEPVPGRSACRLKELPPVLRRRVRAWGKRIESIENENWDAAWEMIRKRGRAWWD